MLDKLAKRVKQDWKTYAQVFSVAAYLVGLLFYFFPKSVIALLLGICFWFAPTLLVRLFGWLRLRYLNDLAMQLGSRNSESRNGAFNRLLRLGEKAVPIFVSILSTPPSQFDALDWDGVKARRLAAKGLGILKAKEGLEELVRALNDSDEILKETAIWALGQIGDQRAITVLLPLLGEPLPRCGCPQCFERFRRWRNN